MTLNKVPLNVVTQYTIKAICALFLVATAGCSSDDLNDLNQFVSEVKSRPKAPIKPLPEIKVIEPFVFKAEDLRDPFKPLAQPEQTEAAVAATGSGIKPDTTRRKEELEAFPLEVLKMVGSVFMDDNLWGLVRADDTTIHRVRLGNYIGKNYGKIIRISVDKIELMEIVPDKPGTWREQQASLVLTE
ncbi:MAG: pilus assembly protein PilP [Methylococcales bacterium]|nr:pilus assembly protein PilP [Methylococcaceae bacterium]